MLAKKERAILRAPVAGIVNEVNVATIGEVIPPGKTLVTIVPELSDLIIEFRIATTDRTPSDFLNELLADRKRLGA